MLGALEDGASLDGVKGISFRDNGGVIRTDARPLIDDLDAMPFSAWDLFDIRRYQPPLVVDTQRPLLLILAGRGCPYRCNFCSNQFGRTYRVRSMSRIVDEMEHFISSLGVRQYVFLDGTFPISSAMGIEFCKTFVARGLHRRVTWTAQMRIDRVDRRPARRHEGGELHAPALRPRIRH